MTFTNLLNLPMFPEETHFDRTNYTTFKNWILIVARAGGAHGYLDSTIQKPKIDPDASDTKVEVKPTE